MFGTVAPLMTTPSSRGNKSSLPSKLCGACGRIMTWRKRWVKNWAEVRYCSDACRRRKGNDAWRQGG